MAHSQMDAVPLDRLWISDGCVKARMHYLVHNCSSRTKHKTAGLEMGELTSKEGLHEGSLDLGPLDLCSQGRGGSHMGSMQ